MRLGLQALGIGTGAQRPVIDAVAAAAETAGFATMWAGEHVVMVDRTWSRYPYAEDGQIAVSLTADWLDPMVCLSFAAAATSTIGVATGFCCSWNTIRWWLRSRRPPWTGCPTVG
jgi:alkanesulfonate monooxygenase SsuD/methylene tetrahydromethanopterin reductase-like flavin-dependent oxidoreductase (luciferase family)